MLCILSNYIHRYRVKELREQCWDANIIWSWMQNTLDWVFAQVLGLNKSYTKRTNLYKKSIRRSPVEETYISRFPPKGHRKESDFEIIWTYSIKVKVSFTYSSTKTNLNSLGFFQHTLYFFLHYQGTICNWFQWHIN